MSELIRKLTVKKPAAKIATFRPGDTVNVHVKVKEGDKERVQVYKGIVTRLQGAGASRTFTVRKISSGVGVERIFPFMSPALDKVELVSHGKVRKARLYYLRELEGKAATVESELATVRKEGAKA
ncbi:MAG: 50S ribosomal protein L19 [Pseudobdellovibrionaceae bacterium]